MDGRASYRKMIFHLGHQPVYVCLLCDLIAGYDLIVYMQAVNLYEDLIKRK